MIHLLKKYADEHLDVEPGFKPKTVKWAVMIGARGKYLGVVELGDMSQKKNPGRTFARCPDLSQPELVKLKGCHFLVESTETAILVTKENEKPAEKALAKHQFFKSLLKNASPSISTLGMIVSVLEDAETLLVIKKDLAEKKAKPNEQVTFAVDDAFPVESEAWHEWWRRFRASISGAVEEKPKEGKRGRKIEAPNEIAGQMVDFATGQLVSPASTFPKISGLSDVGGLGMGDVLAGFDKDSFRSYGLEQSANAAMSEQSSTACRDALNHLIRNNSIRLAGAKVVYWFDKEVPNEDNPLSWLNGWSSDETKKASAESRAREVLESIRSGSQPDLQDNHYYALTLSGMSGRVMTRDWMTGQFEELVENVEAWFKDLSIVHREGDGPAPSPKFLAVLGATVRELDMLTPPFVSKMWRVAVHNEPIPRDAMAKALARMRVDVMNANPFNHARMGLLKAFLIRQGDKTMTPYLNEDHLHPAYHCGRLMAVYASLQTAALGDVGAGVVQRFYSAASATPALVLGRLSRLGQFHLAKIESKGLSKWFENRLASIYGRIKDNPPATITLTEQSLFALGYYQEMASKGSYMKKGNNNDNNTTNEETNNG